MLDNTQSIICAFGLAAAAPRSPYRHLELCGIAVEVRREKLGVCGGQRLVTHPTVGAHKIIDTILVPHLASLEGSCLRSRLKGGSIGSSLSGSANS
ncbi:MAG: hypothetical protein PUF35_09655 [Subdoligranulum sp.]|nr:hypothetical protein [Subdoligranulum sp.]